MLWYKGLAGIGKLFFTNELWAYPVGNPATATQPRGMDWPGQSYLSTQGRCFLGGFLPQAPATIKPKHH